MGCREGSDLTHKLAKNGERRARCRVDERVKVVRRVAGKRVRDRAQREMRHAEEMADLRHRCALHLDGQRVAELVPDVCELALALRGQKLGACGDEPDMHRVRGLGPKVNACRVLCDLDKALVRNKLAD
eukprot:Amastigsp_a406_83.p4 type:complete len:129 gc:universal Amastigsp_a406_83:797-411(-)